MGRPRRRSRELLRPVSNRLRPRGCGDAVRRHRAEGLPAGAVHRMTFGALAAWQAWHVIAAAAGAAAWLFLLKLRPPRIPVPSLLLWQRVLDESRETTL